MKKGNKCTDIVFILDRSGSMCGCESDTIGGYNSYIKSFKDKDAKVTTILFDDEYEILNKRLNIKKVPTLTEKEYFVRGRTALLDAIGKTIKYLDKQKAEKVMFVITTDGYENASMEFNKDQIKELIQGHKNWEFIYIGADIDSYTEGTELGITLTNIANYQKDQKGIKKLFKSIGKASKMYMEDSCIDLDWKEDLEEYISENKES